MPMGRQSRRCRAGKTSTQSPKGGHSKRSWSQRKQRQNSQGVLLYINGPVVWPPHPPELRTGIPLILINITKHILKYQNQVPLTHSRSLSSLGLKGAEDNDLHERRDCPAPAWRWQHRNFKKRDLVFFAHTCAKLLDHATSLSRITSSRHVECRNETTHYHATQKKTCALQHIHLSNTTPRRGSSGMVNSHWNALRQGSYRSRLVLR